MHIFNFIVALKKHTLICKLICSYVCVSFKTPQSVCVQSNFICLVPMMYQHMPNFTETFAIMQEECKYPWLMNFWHFCSVGHKRSLKIHIISGIIYTYNKYPLKMFYVTFIKEETDGVRSLFWDLSLDDLWVVDSTPTIVGFWLNIMYFSKANFILNVQQWKLILSFYFESSVRYQ